MKTNRFTKFLTLSAFLSTSACTEELPQRPNGQSVDSNVCRAGEACELKPDTPAHLMSLWKGKDIVFMGADDKPMHCMSNQTDFSNCTIYDIKSKTKKTTKCEVATTAGAKNQIVQFRCAGKTDDCTGFEDFSVSHNANFTGSEVSVGERGNYATIRESGACESVMNGGSAGPLPAGKEIVGAWEIPCKPNGYFADKVEYIFGGNGEGTFNWTTYEDCVAGDRDFVVSAAFSYSSGQEVIGGRALDITVKTVKIAPVSSAMVDTFNQDKNCGIDNWVINTPREVTGVTCASGSSLKKDQRFFNIYKIEDKKLFLGIQQIGGQTNDPGHDGSTESQRPIRVDAVNSLQQPTSPSHP